MTILAAAAIVRNQEEEILLVQEGKEHVKGLWDFPGGKLEEGEKPKEGVKREVLEETGHIIEPKELKAIYFEESARTGEDVIVFTYLSEIVGEGESNPDTENEIIDTKFYKIDAAKKLDLRKKNRHKMLKDAEDKKTISEDRLIDTR